MKLGVQTRTLIGMLLISAVLLFTTSMVWNWVSKGRKRDQQLSERLENLERTVEQFRTELTQLKGMPAQQLGGGKQGSTVSSSGHSLELVVGFRPAPDSAMINALAQPRRPAPPQNDAPLPPPPASLPAGPGSAAAGPRPPSAPAPPPPAARPGPVAPRINLGDFAPKPASPGPSAGSELPPFNASHHYLHNIVILPQDQLAYRPAGNGWCHECYHWWSRFADEDDSVPPARLEQIRKTIASLIANQNGMIQGTVPKRAVVIKPPGVQLCNRLRNLMAGVILAMLTDRAVHYAFKSGYYAGSGGKVVSGAGGYQASLCDDLAGGADAGAAVLNIDHHTWIAPLLYLNPHLGPVFETKTGGLQGAYKAIFMNLFMPSLNVRQRIEGFFKQHSLYDRPLLAMHLRSGPDFRPAMTDEEWARYGLCAQHITERLSHRAGGGDGRKKAAWFIAADLEESRTRAQKEFAKYNAELVFYSDYLRSNNEEGVQRALTELLLLSIADGRVLTPGSSYSEFAFSLAGPESDSVFVISSAPKGPKFGYPHFEELSPNCRRPMQSDPSLQELDHIIKQSKCKVDKAKAETIYKL